MTVVYKRWCSKWMAASDPIAVDVMRRWVDSIDLPDVEECFGGYLVPVPE